MNKNENDRSTLFTARSTESAMAFFTVIGFFTLFGIFLYEKLHEKEKWYVALGNIWGSVPNVLSFTTMLTIFKEGLDIMFTRLQEYRDKRKKVIEQARKEGYQAGYEAAKAEIKAHENESSSQTVSKKSKKK